MKNGFHHAMVAVSCHHLTIRLRITCTVLVIFKISSINYFWNLVKTNLGMNKVMRFFNLSKSLFQSLLNIFQFMEWMNFFQLYQLFWFEIFQFLNEKRRIWKYITIKNFHSLNPTRHSFKRHKLSTAIYLVWTYIFSYQPIYNTDKMKLIMKFFCIIVLLKNLLVNKIESVNCPKIIKRSYKDNLVNLADLTVLHSFKNIETKFCSPFYFPYKTKIQVEATNKEFKFFAATNLMTKIYSTIFFMNLIMK